MKKPPRAPSVGGPILLPTITIQDAHTRLLKAAELAFLFAVKTQTIHLWSSQGMPTTHLSPTCVRFAYAACLAWLQERRVAQATRRTTQRELSVALGTQVKEQRLH